MLTYQTKPHPLQKLFNNLMVHHRQIITVSNNAVAGSLMAIPLLPPMPLLPDPEAAAKDQSTEMIRSLSSQVCRLKVKMRELKQQKTTSKKRW